MKYLRYAFAETAINKPDGFAKYAQIREFISISNLNPKTLYLNDFR